MKIRIPIASRLVLAFVTGIEIFGCATIDAATAVSNAHVGIGII